MPGGYRTFDTIDPNEYYFDQRWPGLTGVKAPDLRRHAVSADHSESKADPVSTPQPTPPDAQASADRED
jgi:hypothetical protein